MAELVGFFATKTQSAQRFSLDGWRGIGGCGSGGYDVMSGLVQVFHHSRSAAAKKSAALTQNNKLSRRMSDVVY